MASTTPNIGLTLPTGTEGWKRSVINGNFTILDTKMGAVGNTPLQTQINTLSSQLGEKTYAISASSMAVIPSNSDLDNYTTPGSYYSPNSTTTATLLHCPVSGSGFSLHVEVVAGGSNTFIQVIKANSTLMQEFRRYGASGDWVQTNNGLIDFTLSAGTNITINWQRCKKTANAGIVIAEATLTTSAAISANTTILTGAPNIGGNAQHFIAVSDSNDIIPLTISGGTITTRVSIANGAKVRFILTYYWT